MKTTLFVAGFSPRTRARSLAYEFERYGRLVRCDIPAPKTPTSKPYAFIEFEDGRDAEDAFNEMHGRPIDGYILSVQWARTTLQPFHPSDRQLPISHKSNLNRSRSPHHRDRTPSPQRGRSPPRYKNNYSHPRIKQEEFRAHSRSRSPSYSRRRSLSRSPIK
ncbi:hypothetical protein BDB01DRAFT_713748 [Pilobolus umbonatus]|nr:hypothetical protein BDB01DRAFT_713748 [Pilobolus umbonatus]